ncbi:MAG: group II intron reverse transcriptase/maturase [Bacteroidota bacterium]|nr:group II intron reverse transcriptase/maturase [Bacteroidota bacterium]
MKKSNLQKKRKKSEMTDDERVRDFQRKLYRKAKIEKDFRFYVLYDKVCLMHVLREAYRRVRINKGSAGVDGISFKKIERNGLKSFLENIQKELQEKNYKPSPVLRVMIPKANGKMRPLGIPTIKDRVVQMACKMVIEPIFEADFQDCSYGFRPKRSANDAIKEIKQHLNAGRTQVYDADLSSYFDTIPHEKLMILIGKRISDKNVLHLIKMWLKSPVMEDKKIIGGKKNKKGTPQGGVISPLLANIYLNLVDKIVMKMASLPENVRIIRYADDFVILGNSISPRVIEKLKSVLKRMDLQVNTDKTKIINSKETPFDFLGFTFQYRWSKFERNKKYYHVQACKKSRSKIKANIKEYLKHNGHRNKIIIIKNLNAKVKGWLNYFNISRVSQTWRISFHLMKYLKESLYRFHKRKSQRYNASYCRNSYHIWVKKYGLVDPIEYCNRPLLKA